MVDEPSPKKMFLLGINPSTSSGTYRINPSAKKVILGNLQMFKDFVKPFAFFGNPENANIEDKQVGKIKKQGEFWVVEECLEISIFEV